MLLIQEYGILYWQVGDAFVGRGYTFPIKWACKKYTFPITEGCGDAGMRCCGDSLTQIGLPTVAGGVSSFDALQRYSATVRNSPFPLSSDGVGVLEFGLGVLFFRNRRLSLSVGLG